MAIYDQSHEIGRTSGQTALLEYAKYKWPERMNKEQLKHNHRKHNKLMVKKGCLIWAIALSYRIN